MSTRPFFIPRRATNCAVLLSVLVACTETPRRNASLAGMREAAQGCLILEAALDDVLPRLGRELAIADSTAARPLTPQLTEWLESIPGIQPSTLRNYTAANESRQPSCASLPGEVGVLVLPDRGRSIGGFPDTSHVMYWGVRGETGTSGIGISDDGREALLHLGYSCGRLCAGLHAVLLRRTFYGWWRVEHSRLLWVS